MRSSLRLVVFLVGTSFVGLVGGFQPAALRAAAPTSAPAGDPAELVRRALEAAVAGSPESRQRLLDQALAVDRDFAPARWQSGFVRMGGDWVALDEVPRRAADAEGTIEAYRRKRDVLVDTAEHHRALARWCRKHALVDEERIHWAKALEFDASDAEALDALELEPYAGRLLTRAQIAREKAAAGKRLQAARAWQPQLFKWRVAIERGSESERAAALAGLQTIDDPAVLPALEAVFARQGRGDRVLAVNRALVETASRIPGPEATELLLRRAVQGDTEETRALAADELKKRPMHAYVPQLIAALPGRLKTQFHVFVLPGGTVLHEHEVLLEGQQANLALSYESLAHPADAATALLTTPAAYARETALAAAIEQQAQAAKDRLDLLRERVQWVLARTTGFERGDDARLWQRQYENYYGWQAQHAPEKPTYRQTFRRHEAYAAAPTDTLETTTRTRRDPNFSMSCFPAGTGVWTQQGLRPIEQIRMGDRVLAQDPLSGELAYQPVQGTSLRPGVELLAIDLGAETILATPGHPFWVVDEGWRTARQLRPGSRLYALGGVVEVSQIAPSAPASVYNFVVSGWHNYFVGHARLLVHDNSPLEEAARRVPGLAWSEAPRRQGAD